MPRRASYDRLSQMEMDIIRQLRQIGLSLRQISTRLGRDVRNIHLCVSQRLWEQRRFRMRTTGGDRSGYEKNEDFRWEREMATGELLPQAQEGEQNILKPSECAWTTGCEPNSHRQVSHWPHATTLKIYHDVYPGGLEARMKEYPFQRRVLLLSRTQWWSENVMQTTWPTLLTIRHHYKTPYRLYSWNTSVGCHYVW